MRIAFIAHPELPGAWYRGIGPMLALRMRGHEIRQLWPVATERLRGEQLAGCDVLHIHRRHDEDVLRLVRHANERGMAVVYDNDDDLRAVPKNNAAHREYGGFAGDRALRQIRRLVQAADLAIAPSAVIADRFREYGAERVELIENFVADDNFEVSAPSNGDTVVVGWMAGSEHHLDVERVPIRDAIGRLLDAYPQLVVQTIGVGLGLRHERYRSLEPVGFFDLASKVAAFDIGLAVLAGLPFNQARSNIKVKEYAALGRPWLASPIGPYAGLGEKQGGRLVADDGWFEAIGRLLDKPRERRKLAKRARAWGREQLISSKAGLWEQALLEAVERARSKATPRAQQV